MIGIQRSDARTSDGQSIANVNVNVNVGRMLGLVIQKQILPTGFVLLAGQGRSKSKMHANAHRHPILMTREALGGQDQPPPDRIWSRLGYFCFEFVLRLGKLLVDLFYLIQKPRKMCQRGEGSDEVLLLFASFRYNTANHRWQLQGPSSTEITELQRQGI